MTFPLSCLLLASLCAPSSWSVSTGISVIQISRVSVSEGTEVGIGCCWTGILERATVKWLKNTALKDSNIFFNQSDNCTSLALKNVTTEDSGTYVCSVHVEIPYYKPVSGNGTVLTVTTQNNTPEVSSSSSLPYPAIICLTTVALILLLALGYVCNLRKRKVKEARVIYEVPHTDSEVADLDKHSTSSSRGSSQWCQVPVYESFDYFERVETKPSG
ncbi:uncharacterized protein ACBR49_019123 isoform 1-T1 [Aulostomus maculatus]